MQRFFIGLMSGTSMDGVDGVIASFPAGGLPVIQASATVPFDDALRSMLFALQAPGNNEIAREADAAQRLAAVYAQCCTALLAHAGMKPAQISAVGVHGQTIRHRPEAGWTRQTNDPSRLAELSGIDVIADFRSRDLAAGGQGAPLVPAFHAMVFGAPGETRVICNIGGISNVSILHGQQAASGFDCGPGNVLLDHWAGQTLGMPYDQDGRLAASGRINEALLATLLKEPFFGQSVPKSTGRDLFNPDWLDRQLAAFRSVSSDRLSAEDVQATLTALSAQTIANDVRRHAPNCATVYVCGGGARNPVLLDMLEQRLNRRMDPAGDALADDRPRAATTTMATGIPLRVRVVSTDALGIDHQQVEALAFAWLAMRFTDRLPGNLPAVTGAAGPRVLGALYPK